MAANFDATDFGYVSILRDNADLENQTNTKVGGAACVWGYATSAMSPGYVVIHDTSADYSYTTTTSADATTIAGYMVAVMNPNNQWDFNSAAASGDKVLIVKSGRVKAVASTSISRGARVGTSTTAGQVVTTTTQDASYGRAVTAATTQGDAIYVDIPG